MDNNEKLRHMTELIEDDCRRFGMDEASVLMLEKDILKTKPDNDDYYFYYDDEKGYVLTFWERGFCNFGMGSADPLGFRFLFQRHIVLHDFSDIPVLERFMREAAGIFGDTSEYREGELFLKKKKEAEPKAERKEDK